MAAWIAARRTQARPPLDPSGYLASANGDCIERRPTARRLRVRSPTVLILLGVVPIIIAGQSASSHARA
jgi:hypothetical protein